MAAQTTNNESVLSSWNSFTTHQTSNERRSDKYIVIWKSFHPVLIHVSL